VAPISRTSAAARPRGYRAADFAGFARWVAGVQHLKPGARMPSYDRLDAESLQVLAAFLEQLQ
jgi:cytochrome c oxidase subunit 2